MIPYVGDLSRNDAALLKELAEQAHRILEFGAGASTQIFAAYGEGLVHSVETDPAWIRKTERNLDRLYRAIKLRPVRFFSYVFEPEGPYDLIFVDGVDELRQAFAVRTWPHLAVGGTMAFHDTRRRGPHGVSATSDMQNVCALVLHFLPEIDSVLVNTCESNTTLVRKRVPLLLEDWNIVEGRTPEQIGLA